MTCTPASGSTFPIGATTVTCTATDARGNTGSASFTVTVADTTGTGGHGAGECDRRGDERDRRDLHLCSVGHDDLVDGSVAVTCTPASGATFPIGATTVTCTATDARGNTGIGVLHRDGGGHDRDRW